MRLLDNNEVRKQFCSFIYEGRLKKQLYQGEIAEQLGITQANYSQIENGVREPSLTVILNICRILELDFNDFLMNVSKRRKIPEKTKEGENLTLF